MTPLRSFTYDSFGVPATGDYLVSQSSRPPHQYLTPYRVVTIREVKRRDPDPGLRRWAVGVIRLTWQEYADGSEGTVWPLVWYRRKRR